MSTSRSDVVTQSVRLYPFFLALTHVYNPHGCYLQPCFILYMCLCKCLTKSYSHVYTHVYSMLTPMFTYKLTFTMFTAWFLDIIYHLSKNVYALKNTHRLVKPMCTYRFMHHNRSFWVWPRACFSLRLSFHWWKSCQGNKLYP